jgi:predicted secreted Zn-dependent protease
MRSKYLIHAFMAAMLLPMAALCSTYIQPPLDQYAPDADYIIYYDIRGSTEEDLRQQMNWLGPVGLDGKTHMGFCEWEGEVSLKITMTLPRWTPPENAAPNLIAKWDNFVKNLAKHENGHAIIARANAGSPNIQGLSDAYDAETNHGANQGVSFDDPQAYDPANTSVRDILSDSPIPALSPRKSVAERFVELNKMKRNNTRQNIASD